MNLRKSILFIPLLLLFFFSGNTASFASIPGIEKSAANIVYTKRLHNDIAYLCDSICEGRGSGTTGAVMASVWAKHNFEKWKLSPLDENYYQCGFSEDSTFVHNVCGTLHSKRSHPQKYIVICAHYDGIGKIGEHLYPGADSNASGSVAVVNLARMFSGVKMLGVGPSIRLMFVLFDGKEKNSAGAKEWVRRLKEGELRDPDNGHILREKDIKMVVNIDQVGATYSPIRKGEKDYLMMLGNDKLPRNERDYAKIVSREESCRLNLSYDYYGSSNFTRVFYRLGDREALSQCNFPLVYFTSGITLHNNKISDNADSLDYEVFRKRILFIFHWLCRFVY